MSDEQQFLDQILADPDDDGPRLVYADWLLDRDDPRGEFIQLQCAREHLPEFSSEAFAMRKRELELLRTHRREWAGELDDLLYPYDFRRGFVGWGRINVSHFLDIAPKLFTLAPLQELMFARSDLSNLHHRPELARLKSICFSKCRASAGDFAKVLASDYLQNIQGLAFAECQDVPFRRLSRLQSLEALSIRESTMRGWNPWIEQVRASKLGTLRIKGGRLAEQLPHAFEQISDSPIASQLETLSFCDWHNRVKDLHRLNSPNWSRLKKLEIALPTTASITSMLHSPRRLTALSVEAYTSQPELKPAHLQQLLRTDLLSELHLLRMVGTVSDAHVPALTEWHRLSSLARLNLASNSMTVAGLRALLKALPEDRRFTCDLRSNTASEEGIAGLLEEFGPDCKPVLAGQGWYLGDTQGRDWAGANLTLK